jgi:hypothetical protein
VIGGHDFDARCSLALDDANGDEPPGRVRDLVVTEFAGDVDGASERGLGKGERRPLAPHPFAHDRDRGLVDHGDRLGPGQPLVD